MSVVFGGNPICVLLCMERGQVACKQAAVPTLCAVWHLPGRELPGLWWLPRTPPQTDSWQRRKSSYTLVNRSHSCSPLIFWSFDIFLVVSIPFLVFPSVSQRQKCLNNWGQRYLLAVTATFSRHWLRTYHKECRERVRWKIISFFFPETGIIIFQYPCPLLANQSMLWEREENSFL